VIEECSDLCISCVQARFYGGSGGLLSHTVSSAWRKAAARLGGDGAAATGSKPEEEDTEHEFSSASQFAGDVVAHVMLSALMMTLLLGWFSPAATLVVEWIVLLLFLGDEVPRPRTAVHSCEVGLRSRHGVAD
jgi:hypothetical protein